LKRAVPILNYHSIDDSTQADPRFKEWVLDPDIFDAHLSYLKSEGYQALTVTDFITHKANNTLPEKPIVITFDDGFADALSHALPILQKYHYPATLYLTTAYIGKTSEWLAFIGEGDRAMLSWLQVRELHQAGIECGAHSHTHPQLDLLSRDAAKQEIATSKSLLDQELGVSTQSFAYPHGYHTQGIMQTVASLGFSSACAVKHALSSNQDNPFSLSRIIVYNTTTVTALAQLITGQDSSLRRTGPLSRVYAALWRERRRLDKFLGKT
jgi:peptidoglycan/xylan/chitin deacetylase (PgdA/CDA1 family)